MDPRDPSWHRQPILPNLADFYAWVPPALQGPSSYRIFEYIFGIHMTNGEKNVILTNLCKKLHENRLISEVCPLNYNSVLFNTFAQAFFLAWSLWRNKKTARFTFPAVGSALKTFYWCRRRCPFFPYYGTRYFWVPSKEPEESCLLWQRTWKDLVP